MPDTHPVPYTGAEDETSHEQHLRYLAAECCKVKPNPTVTQQLMRMFALRRKEIKEDHLSKQEHPIHDGEPTRPCTSGIDCFAAEDGSVESSTGEPSRPSCATTFVSQEQ